MILGRRRAIFGTGGANNLYGHAMSEFLPVRNFKWMTEDQLRNRRCRPCFLEVDLKYPEKLHDLHNDHPLAPERVKIGKVAKLICSLHDKEKYVVHHKTLKFYLSLGMEVTKVHRGVTFEEEAWLKP
jgi:hypothetical protein